MSNRATDTYILCNSGELVPVLVIGYRGYTDHFNKGTVRATFTLALSSTGCNRLGPTAEGNCSLLLDPTGGNTPVRIPGHETMVDGASYPRSVILRPMTQST